MSLPRGPRRRPTLTVTIDAEHMRRLKVVVGKMPGGKLSALVDEMVGMTLPIFEEVVDAFQKARRPDGSLDEAMAQERVEAYLGSMMFKYMASGHNADTLPETGGDQTT